MIVPELPLRTDTNKRVLTEATSCSHGTSDTPSILDLELEDPVEWLLSAEGHWTAVPRSPCTKHNEGCRVPRAEKAPTEITIEA